MELLFNSLRIGAAIVMRLLSFFLNFCWIWVAAITLPPDHPQSTTRLRSYRQCHHRPAFLGGAFTSASAV